MEILDQLEQRREGEEEEEAVEVFFFQIHYLIRGWDAFVFYDTRYFQMIRFEFEFVLCVWIWLALV